MEKYVEGYKVFDPDWKCRGFQYEVGKTFEEDVTPSCCIRGFHFCKELKECFNYYTFDSDNKVAKVIALGDIDEELDSNKCCTNKIKIVEEISWEDVLKMVNTGKANSGCCNSGDCNSGDWNSGDCNSGNRNSGNRNSGNCNSGDCNSGNRNSGNCNSGNWNSGDWNSGNWNSGNWNSGDWNSGNCNIGDWNSGNWNSGNRNSGNCNSGNCNSGDWNSTDFSNGCFNTEEPKIFLFNKPSNWTYSDWTNSYPCHLLKRIPKNVVEWIYEENMTDEEKEKYQTYKTTGGYLKTIDNSNNAQNWWDALSENDKSMIKSIPNFDKDIFEEILGIKI